MNPVVSSDLEEERAFHFSSFYAVFPMYLCLNFQNHIKDMNFILVGFLFSFSTVSNGDGKT
jgi:hypothetical protein